MADQKGSSKPPSDGKGDGCPPKRTEQGDGDGGMGGMGGMGGKATQWLADPRFKYVGFALLLSWHYTLWFVPHMFPQLELLDDRVTISWLVNLGAMAASLLAIMVALGRKRHLSDHAWVFWTAPVATAIGTAVLCLLPHAFLAPAVAYVLSFALGVFEAAQWVLWGERFASVKANFTMAHFGATCGTIILTVALAAWALPVYATAIFTALLPLASGFVLMAERKHGAGSYPVLLPKSAAKGGIKNMGVVSAMGFLASVALYFLVAIIPWQVLPFRDQSFTFGIVMAGAILLAIAGICALSKNGINIFKTFPWMIVLGIVSFALFLDGRPLYFPSFFLATALSSLLEVLLIMYFGVLTSKGYTTPAAAFAFSGAFARAGIALGNTWAVAYEGMPSLHDVLTPPTCLLLMCVLAALLIPLVRQEYNLVALTAKPPTKSEIEVICSEAAKEFGLSARETEVLTLIARGHTTKSIAEKLVLSPYTVNTHIRHIYDKMQIHKRSELINYLNMQRSDF